jgi:branched-chain amino acid aminotransferase
MNPPSAPITWINGRLVPASEASVPVTDRAVLYGDSIFETVPIRNGSASQWAAHLGRLSRGEQITGIASGLSADQWTEALASLLQANSAVHGAVRVTVTRGSGPRGYSPRGAHSPNRILTWHPSDAPTQPHGGWHLRTSRFRVIADDPLAPTKHGSRLPQVLARAEAEANGADEALLLNTRGEVAETSTGNLFWIRGGTVGTPPRDSGALAGITARVIERAVRAHGWPFRAEPVTPEFLAGSEGAFVSLSTTGIIPILSIDGRPMPSHSWIAILAREFLDGMDRAPL